MAKISSLPLLDQPTGDELVPAVSGDVTHRAPIGALVQPQVDLAAQYAAAASAMARRVVSFDAGIAGTAAGDDFSVVDSDGGWIDIYRHGESADADHPLIKLPGQAAYGSGRGTSLLGHGRTNIALPLDKSLPRTLGWLGVDPYTIASQHAKLVDAFDIASFEGFFVQGHPDATYRKDGPLSIAGVSFDGQGCIFTALSDGPQAMMLMPAAGGPGFSGVRWSNFKTLSAANERASDTPSCGIALGAIELAAIDTILLHNLEVGGVEPGRGPGAAAYAFANLSRLRSFALIARNSHADGFYHTHGAQDCKHSFPIADGVGDDSFSVVSYRVFGKLCEDIDFQHGLSVNGGSRGIAVVGGRNVRGSITVRGSAAAAGYIFSEDSYDTLGNEDVRLLIRAEECVRGGGATGGDAFANAIGIIGGRAGTDMIGGLPYDRSSRDCEMDIIIRNAGAHTSAGVEYASRYAVRSRVKVDIQDVLQDVPAIIHGGEDSELMLRGRRLGGVPIALSADAIGRHYIHDVKIDGARLAHPGADTNVLSMAAPGITELRIERAEFNNSSARLINDDAGFDLDRFRFRDVKIDGMEQTGKDYAVVTPAFANGWTSSPDAPLLVTKRPDGFIALAGAVMAGDSYDGVFVLQLPDGAHPKSTQRRMVLTSTGAVAVVELRSNGGVAIVSGAAALVELNLDFLAA